MDAVIPAAGRGTRLRPLTDDRPKPLVEVAGRPLLERVFDALVPADPDRFVVVIGYRGEQVREHVGDAYRGTPVEFVRQEEPLGLAHAVAQAAPVVEDSLLVCNGDNVLGSDLGPLAEAHRESEAAATLLVEAVSVEAARETGVVVTDDDGRVERTIEKPDDPPSDSLRSVEEPDPTRSGRPPSTLVSAGAFAFSNAIFDACRAIEPSDRGEYELPDAITWLIERGHEVRTRRYEGERVNVNAPADLDRAEEIVGDRGR